MVWIWFALLCVSAFRLAVSLYRVSCLCNGLNVCVCFFFFSRWHLLVSWGRTTNVEWLIRWMIFAFRKWVSFLFVLCFYHFVCIVWILCPTPLNALQYFLCFWLFSATFVQTKDEIRNGIQIVIDITSQRIAIISDEYDIDAKWLNFCDTLQFNILRI